MQERELFTRTGYPHAQLPNRTAYLNGASVAEQTLYFSEYDRYGVGGELDSPVPVKSGCRFYQPHAARAVKIVVLYSLTPETVCAQVNKPKIFFGKTVVFQRIHGGFPFCLIWLYKLYSYVLLFSESIRRFIITVVPLPGVLLTVT